ncbi:MAG: phosphoribosylanthranilate isomerase [Promethearchaeota archaeon]
MEYIKICGLKKPEDIKLCIDYGANAIGFIYNVPDSPRNLSKQEITELLKLIPNTIKKVVITRVNCASEVEQLIRHIEVDLYQLHCSFNIRDLDKFPMVEKKKMIIALKVTQESKDDVLRKINHSFDQFFAFLIDNSQGSGAEIDFDLVLDIRKKSAPSKIIIAGGINVDNVEALIKHTQPYGIDVSSSLEIERGIKDSNKIKEFLDKVNEVKNNY